MAFVPPFTVFSGDAKGIISDERDSFPTLPEAQAFVDGMLLEQDRFWEIHDSTGAWVTGGYKPIVHSKPKKPRTGRRSRVVRPKTVKPKKVRVKWTTKPSKRKKRRS
jgi:hypothetical protein